MIQKTISRYLMAALFFESDISFLHYFRQVLRLLHAYYLLTALRAFANFDFFLAAVFL
jgi:hypothetical protein